MPFTNQDEALFGKLHYEQDYITLSINDLK